MISVVIFGAGNLASHLYKAFCITKDVVVKQRYNRDISKLESVTNTMPTTNSLSEIVEADIYILAISDDAIAAVSKALPFTNRLVVHTSGSLSIHAIDKKHDRGVLYPLQTFSKAANVNFSNVPFCIEALKKSNLEFLKTLTKYIGSPCYKINTDQRQTLHVSAVFINNFVNQLYRIAHEISDAKQINFDILKPLIIETANKVQTMSPYMAQTGPAIRNDKTTIKRHLKQLEQESHKTIYELLTQSIKQTHNI